MFDWLGGLFGGLGSIAGASINASEQQQANQANIQQAQYMATGQYLPQLVSNAQRAGINPLAALGIHTPGFGVSQAALSGSGVAGAAQDVAATFNRVLHQNRLEQAQLNDMKLTAEQKGLAIDNQHIQNQVQQEVYDRIRGDKGLIPGGWGEPASRTSYGIPQASWMSQVAHDWLDYPGSNWGPDYPGKTGMFGGLRNPWDTYRGWR